MNLARKYFPLLIGLIIFVAVLLFAPWDSVIPLIARTNLESIGALVLLSVVYYVAKSLRYWVMLRILGIRQPLLAVMLVYMAAQPASVLPAGELFRSVMLERELGVPVRKSASTVTLQGLIEAVVLIGFSVLGAFVLGKDRLAVLLVGTIAIALLVALERGWFVESRSWLNKLPLVHIKSDKFAAFIRDHQKLLTPKALGAIIGLSIIPVLCGIGIFTIAARAIGAPISFGDASIGYSLPVVLSGLSFLPGGLGVSEGGTIGILKLIGVGTAASFAITLLLRLFTLGAGMLFGLVALGIIYVRKGTK